MKVIFLSILLLDTALAQHKDNTFSLSVESTKTTNYDTSNESTTKSKKIYLMIKPGIKLSEQGDPGTKTGWRIGFEIEFSTGKQWCAIGGINYWKSKSNFRLADEQVKVVDYSLLFSFNQFIASKTVVFIGCGPGFGISQRTREHSNLVPSEENSNLLSFRYFLGVKYQLSNSIILVYECQQELLGVVSLGGGESYSPFLLSIGVAFPM